MPNLPVVILGAGPAGLTAAYELGKAGVRSTVLERDDTVGGLARTVKHNGYRFDIGGHRFFTKVSAVEALWREILGDDLLTRPRLSRIYYNGAFFSYPLKPFNALAGLGLLETIRCVASYGRARVFPTKPEEDFATWITNRFGKRLFEIFFKTYTEKVWGIPCTQIDAEWAARRLKYREWGIHFIQVHPMGCGLAAPEQECEIARIVRVAAKPTHTRIHCGGSLRAATPRIGRATQPHAAPEQ